MSALLLLLASCVRVSELYHHALWRPTLWYPLTALPELLGLASLLCRPGLVARIGTADEPVPQPKVRGWGSKNFLVEEPLLVVCLPLGLLQNWCACSSSAAYLRFCSLHMSASLIYL